LLNRDILEAENPNGPSRQMAAAAGSVEQGEIGLWMGDGQGDTGEAYTRSYVEDPGRGRSPHTREHQRVGEVAVNDTRCFEGPNTTRLNPLGREPTAEVAKSLSLGRAESYSGPTRRSIQLIVEVFPVKHAN
jgi:hypothetical protein